MYAHLIKLVLLIVTTLLNIFLIIPMIIQSDINVFIKSTIIIMFIIFTLKTIQKFLMIDLDNNDNNSFDNTNDTIDVTTNPYTDVYKFVDNGKSVYQTDNDPDFDWNNMEKRKEKARKINSILENNEEKINNKVDEIIGDEIEQLKLKLLKSYYLEITELELDNYVNKKFKEIVDNNYIFQVVNGRIKNIIDNS